MLEELEVSSETKTIMNAWNIEEERRFYDRLTSRVTLEEFKKHLDNRMNDVFWPAIFRKIRSVKDKQVLDLGCGLGYDSAILALKGAKVVGIDISSGCIEKAHSFLRSLGLGSRTQFQVMNASSLDFPEKYFDLVFGRAILHHILPEGGLKEVHRVVKDNCCFIEPLASNPIRNLYRLRAERSPYPHYELTRLIHLMAKEFSCIWHDEYYLLTPTVNVLQKLVDGEYKNTFYILMKVDRLLCEHFPHLKNYCGTTLLVAFNKDTRETSR